MMFFTIIIAIASIAKARPLQFITGACSDDADCASGCCETNQNICRAPLSMTPGVQSCKDGRTPNFDNGAKLVNINNKGAAATAQVKVANPPADSGKSKGSQFITGACSADADCASGCCETNQNICRAPLSMTPGVQSCKDGRTPNFDNGAKLVQI
jgi:hypothetical protein